MKWQTITFVVIGILFLASCGKVDCITTGNELYIQFQGFEADTGVDVYISRLPVGGGDPIQIDTITLNGNNSSYSMYEGFNWEVYVPETGKRDRISGIFCTHDTRKKGLMEGGGWGDQCINVCTGYYLNGNYVATGYTAAVPYGGSTTAAVVISK